MNERIRFIAVSSLTLALTACHITDWQLWHPSDPAAAPFEVERTLSVPYYDGPQADTMRHRLDIYAPKGKKDCPVVFLVHGGAWIVGDNRCCGLYSSVGEFLASQGIVAVLPNYRLSPHVKHPEHIKDVARAFAWTKHHIAEHGGRPERIVIAGHSAGAHLVALLATDESYLKGFGCRSSDIQGVICVSGVYRIPAGKSDVELGGTTPLALRLDVMTPLRGDGAKADGQPDKAGVPISLDIFKPAFGIDPQVRASASPVTHVRKGLPPFLFLNADKELPLLPGMAQEMHETLLRHGNESRLLKIEGRNHNSVLFQAIEPSDPVARHILDFVRGS